MSRVQPADDLIGLEADPRLLTQPGAELPTALGQPEPIPVSTIRGRLVGVGSALTGLTLIGGVALAILAAVELLADGGGALAVIALVLGLVLAGTHWGWVHVAEATADSLQRRRNAAVVNQREQWLREIAPFTRYEITTSVSSDGSIIIDRVRHRPVRRTERTFAFATERELSEVHAGDEPAAAIAERAELLRRQAAVDTERERERFSAQADALQRTALAEIDDRDRRQATVAASHALSDQINANLRAPPFVE